MNARYSAIILGAAEELTTTAQALWDICADLQALAHECNLSDNLDIEEGGGPDEELHRAALDRGEDPPSQA